MSRPTYIVIDAAALQHNVRQIKHLAPHSSIIAMVKANAYGHGILSVAPFLTEVDALGVACLAEAMTLRRAHCAQPIVLMEGCFSEADLLLACQHNMTLVVHHQAQIDYLERNPHLPPVGVWLKINTGMHRLGFQGPEVKKAYQRLWQCPAVKKPFGLMTHLSSTSFPRDSYTDQQIALFDEITQGLKGPQSLVNSGGILHWPSAHRDWVRPGLLLYGVSPIPATTGMTYDLRPVMTLQSQLMALQYVRQNEAVGYDRTWVCPSDRWIGVVAIGYGDGYPQHASTGTPVLINGSWYPLVGRVSMDMLTVDLGAHLKVKIGDGVTLWGKGLPVETVADYNQMSAYELLSRLTARLTIQFE